MNIGVETEKCEYKKTTGELKEGIISLASMLNKNGYGTLYFGVRNNGDIVGQQIGDRTLRDISQGIANNLKPQVIPTINHELLDENRGISRPVNTRLQKISLKKSVLSTDNIVSSNTSLKYAPKPNLSA